MQQTINEHVTRTERIALTIEEVEAILRKHLKKPGVWSFEWDSTYYVNGVIMKQVREVTT